MMTKVKKQCDVTTAIANLVVDIASFCRLYGRPPESVQMSRDLLAGFNAFYTTEISSIMDVPIRVSYQMPLQSYALCQQES